MSKEADELEQAIQDAEQKQHTSPCGINSLIVSRAKKLIEKWRKEET